MESFGKNSNTGGETRVASPEGFDYTEPLRGYNDPHIFNEDKVRIVFTVEAARAYTVKYFKQLFKKEFDITLNNPEELSRPGDFRIMQINNPNSNNNSKSFRLIYVTEPNKCISIDTSVAPNCTGVSHRELFLSLQKYLKNHESITVTHMDVPVATGITSQTLDKNENILPYINNFAQLFQKTHGVSPSFNGSATYDGRYKIVLKYTINGTESRYPGSGINQEVAKAQAIARALQAGVFSEVDTSKHTTLEELLVQTAQKWYSSRKEKS